MATESTIGMRIKALRESRDMTQEELGVIIGLDANGVSELESNGDGDINVDTIKRVCETFHEYPSFLIFEEDDKYWNRMLGKKPTPKGSKAYISSPKTSEMMAAIGKTIESTLGRKDLSIIHSVTALNESGLARASTLVSDLLKIRDYRSEK